MVSAYQKIWALWYQRTKGLGFMVSVYQKFGALWSAGNEDIQSINMGVAHASAGSRGLGVATGTGAAKQDQRRGKTLSQVELLAHEPTQGRGPAECVRHRFWEAYIYCSGAPGGRKPKLCFDHGANCVILGAVGRSCPVRCLRNAPNVSIFEQWFRSQFFGFIISFALVPIILVR